jgi:hypothetical protein
MDLEINNYLKNNDIDIINNNNYIINNIFLSITQTTDKPILKRQYNLDQLIISKLNTHLSFYNNK